MATKHITIRLDESTLADVDTLAKDQERSRAYILSRAIIAGLAVISGAPVSGHTGLETRGEIEITTAQADALPVEKSAKRTKPSKANGHAAGCTCFLCKPPK